MNHPVIVEANAKLRFDEMVRTAELHRRALQVAQKKRTWFDAIRSVFTPPEINRDQNSTESPVILRA